MLFVVAVPFIGCAPKPREEFVISLVIIVVVLLLRLGKMLWLRVGI